MFRIQVRPRRYAPEAQLSAAAVPRLCRCSGTSRRRSSWPACEINLPIGLPESHFSSVISALAETGCAADPMPSEGLEPRPHPCPRHLSPNSIARFTQTHITDLWTRARSFLHRCRLERNYVGQNAPDSNALTETTRRELHF